MTARAAATGGEEPGVASVSDKIRIRLLAGASSSLSLSPRRRRRLAGTFRLGGRLHAHALDAATHLADRAAAAVPARGITCRARREARGGAGAPPTATRARTRRRRPGGIPPGSARERKPPALGVLRDGVLPRARGGDQLGNQAQRERARGKTRARGRKSQPPPPPSQALARRRLSAARRETSSSPPHLSADGPISAISASAHRRVVPEDGVASAAHAASTRSRSASPKKGGATATSPAPPADAERPSPSARPRARAVRRASVSALRAHPRLGVQRASAGGARVQGPAGVLRGARAAASPRFSRRRE